MFEALLLPDKRLEYQYSQWQSSNSRTLAVKVHAISTVCWAVALFKVLILLYRMSLGEVVFRGLKEETLIVLALMDALNVGHNVALTRGLFKRHIWADERARLFCITISAISLFLAKMKIGKEMLCDIFDIPGTFEGFLVTSMAVALDQIRLKESLPWLLGNFGLFAVSEVYDYFHGVGMFALCKPFFCLVMRMASFSLTGLVLLIGMMIVIEGRQRHRFLEFYDDLKSKRLLLPFWYPAVSVVDAVYYFMCRISGGFHV